MIENKNYYIQEIDVKTAKNIILTYHYSHKVVPNSKLHLGIFRKSDNALVGALQYGYPMNPKRTPEKLVKGSSKEEMYELNRMAMLDEEPKFCESQAISLSIRWIKKNKPHIKWLLSYSDGKEGNVGIIYQATNWKYFGYKVSDSFYNIDNEVYHSVQIWHKFINRPSLINMNTTYSNFFNVSRFHARQYIYIMPLTSNLIFNLNEVTKYPKRESEPKIVKEIIYKENGITLNKKR